jgi:hypothetical protein
MGIKTRGVVAYLLLSFGLAWGAILVAQVPGSGSVWVPCLAHAGNDLIIGTLSFSLLVDGGGLDPSTVQLLELIPRTVAITSPQWRS